MTKLWILLAATLIMAFLVDYRDQELSFNGHQRRERLVTCLLILVFGFFCGLRTWGNDTVTYMQMYEQIPAWDEYRQKTNTYEFAHGIGFGVVLSLLKTMEFSTQDYLMFFAFATAIPYVLFVRKYSQSMVFGVFLMLTTGFYTFSMAAIKQCMATAICLLALMAATDRKWVLYGLLVALASLFHPYALVYLLVPFMMFKPWTGKTFFYIGLFMVVGFYLDSLIGTVVDMTAMMGAEYDINEFTGAGVNIFRVAVSFVPLILAALYGKSLFRDSTPTDDLMFNLAMLNALIMFVGLFGTANYFARLANYFLPAQIIVLPWILNRVHPRDRAWLLPACIAGYLGYFYYENAIIRPFDMGYPQMSIWEYLWE